MAFQIFLAFFIWKVIFIVVFLTISDGNDNRSDRYGGCWDIWQGLILSSLICAGLYYLI